jgi:hypothetical protein
MNAPSPLAITLYGKPGCHLCDDLRTILDDLRSEFDFALVERNIEDDPDDFTRFRYSIPALDIAGKLLLYPPHDAVSIRRALLAAGKATE